VAEACLFDIMSVPDETLKKVLPKVSIRMVSRLIAAYPRAVGRTLLQVLSQNSSPFTIEFLRDEMNTSRIPTLAQIREAEKEFLMTLRAEPQSQPSEVLKAA
jgi:hypothetical protein